ncbi:MAG: 6-carboxytetrahydropterin synthase QueD [Acidobacteriota bacterium]|jgi:6-pyruvoyltetrahydropterin/6-carboxytetrahydropterin synthase
MAPKFTIFKDFQISAAHAIRGHTRGCQNLHGHNYRVRVHASARDLDELGMVIDFADLKALTSEVVGPLDHRVINEIAPFDERNTTAELIAQWVHHEVSARLDRLPEAGGRVRIDRVEVWETPNSCAIYEDD